MKYRLPIDFYGFFQKIELSKNKKGARFELAFGKINDVKESIDQCIELIVFTHPGECKFAPDFGFSFWENEFKNISIDSFNSTDNPRKSFENNLKDAISMYEPRLDNVKVEILLSDAEMTINKTRIKFLVTLSIQALIRDVQPKPYSKVIVFSVGPVIKK
jgi:predicted component of type VI protein secretion system